MQDVHPRRVDAPAAETPAPQVMARLGRPPGCAASAEQSRGDIAALRVAAEELRVVEEELRVQQEQTGQLLSRCEAERRRRILPATVVPAPLCLSDGAGRVLDANPALAGLLGIALGRLVGKPLSVHLHPGDVPVFRSALRSLTSGQVSEHRSTVRLRPGGRDEDRAVSLFGSPDADADAGSEGGARLLWVVLPAAQPPDDVRGIADALPLSAAADTPALMSDSRRAAVPGREEVPLAVPGSAESSPAAVGEPPARALGTLGRRVRKGPCLTRPRDEAAVLGPGLVRAAGPGCREFGATAHGPPGAWSGSPPVRPPPAGEGAAARPVTVPDAAGLRRGVRACGPAPGVPGGRAARVRGACLRAEEGVP